MPIQVSAEVRDVRLCCAGCKGLNVELCYSFGVVPHYCDLCTRPPVTQGYGWVLETLLFLPESHVRMGRRGVFLKHQYFKSKVSKDILNKDNTDCNSLQKIYIYIYAAAHRLVSHWLLWVQLYLRGCAGVPIWRGRASCSISTWWMGVYQREVAALFTLSLLVGWLMACWEMRVPWSFPDDLTVPRGLQLLSGHPWVLLRLDSCIASRGQRLCIQLLNRGIVLKEPILELNLVGLDVIQSSAAVMQQKQLV